ncbi:unnamed protein product [Miscanthus lutarioriparius]|uniref:Uncharacterized protein n=1 Tax=Miscanthus lutarioriparius TaxID=422564 RepID=A0A811QMN9_9POAL|nr:unnamed protein product [Miscanthus lutarioriparius]
MSSDQKSDVPGGYFVGRPTNHAAEKTEEPPHAGGEQNPVAAQTPGAVRASPAVELRNRSTTASCCPAKGAQ